MPPLKPSIWRSPVISFLQMSVRLELVGPYYVDSDATPPEHGIAQGWKGLTIGEYLKGKAAPYRVDRNGTPIGWAPGSSLRIVVGRAIVVGAIIADG